MKNKLVVGITLTLIFTLLAFFLSACESTVSSPSAPSDSPTTGAPLDGQALMQARCTVCHTTARIESKSATAEQWATTVDRMIGKGAQLDSTERQTLIDYLAQTYP